MTLKQKDKVRLRNLYEEMGAEKVRADIARAGWHHVLSDADIREFAMEWLTEHEKRSATAQKWKKVAVFVAVAAGGGLLGYMI